MAAFIEELRPEIDWQRDIERVSVLFGPFRDRELNPEAYDSKLIFWTETIERWLKATKKLTFTIPELTTALTFEDRRPHCLQDVIGALCKKKVLVTETDFNHDVSKKLSETWSGWTWQVMKRSSSRMLQSVIGASQSSENQVYIHTEVLEQRSKLTLDQVRNQGQIVKESDVLETDRDSVLLKWLHANKRIDLREVNGTTYIKLDSKFEDKDVARLQLEHLIKKSESEIDAMETEASDKKNEIRNILSNKGSRARAKASLKQVKRLEARIEKKANNVDNLSIILEKINEADDNVKVVEALRQGRLALKSQLEQGPNLDSITELLDDIGDLLADQADITNAISNSVEVGETSLSDEQLEQDLQDLLKEEDDLTRALTNLKVIDDNIIVSDEQKKMPGSGGVSKTKMAA